MKFSKELSLKIAEDSKIINLDNTKIFRGKKDFYHLDRRKSQRAIDDNMIKIALTYGYKKWIRGALTYTITDRSLKNTLFYKFISSLRGLKVVCLKKECKLLIKTVYWCKETINKYRYS